MTQDNPLSKRRTEQFAQANASLALEGMQVNKVDLAIQDRVASGEITADQAVQLYRDEAKRRAK